MVIYPSRQMQEVSEFGYQRDGCVLSRCSLPTIRTRAAVHALMPLTDRREIFRSSQVFRSKCAALKVTLPSRESVAAQLSTLSHPFSSIISQFHHFKTEAVRRVLLQDQSSLTLLASGRDLNS
jgi:hypothetical protein